MAQIPTWQPSVTKQAGSLQPITAPSGDVTAPAFAGLDKVISAAKTYQDNQDKMNVSNIYSNFNDKLNNAFYGQDGLLTQEGKNAIDLPEAPGQQSQDGVAKRAFVTYNLAMNDAIAGAQNNAQKAMLQQTLLISRSKWLEAAQQHQQQQQQVVDKANYATGIDVSTKGLSSALAMGNYNLAVMNLNDIKHKTDIYGNANGWYDAVTKNTADNSMSSAVLNSISGLIDSNNIPMAQKALNEFGDKLSADQRNAIDAKMKPIMQKNSVEAQVMAWDQDPSMHINGDLNQPLDEAKIEQAGKDKYLNRTTTIVHPAANGTATDEESFYNSTATQESRGDYNAKGAVQSDGDYAIGKYQIMKSNWSSWAQEAGLSADAPTTPENQDKVFKNKMHQYYVKYGPQGAAVAWYSGEANAERWVNGAADAIDGNGNHYSWDAQQGGAPSIRGYVNGVMSRTSYSGTPETTETVANPDYTTYDAVLARARQRNAEIQLQRSQRNTQLLDIFENQIRSNNPTTLAEVESIAKNVGFTGSDLTAAIAKGMGMVGLVREDENRQRAETFDAAIGDIMNGNITTEADLTMKYAGKLHNSQLIQLESSLNKESKWATPENLGAYRGVLTAHGIKAGSTEANQIYQKITLQVKDNISKGIPFAAPDIQTWAEEQAQSVIIRKPWYQPNTKTYQANVPPGWRTTEYGVLDPNGNEADFVNGQWVVKGK